MYYGWGFDPTFLILIPAFLFAMFAQSRVKSVFRRYSEVRGGRGMTGARAAREVLDANGLYDVPVVRVAGDLTDHYDPRDRTVHLSETVYDRTSVSAVSVACHECGHAVQHAEGYAPLTIRDAIVPVVNLASSLSWILIMIGLGLLVGSTQTASFGNIVLQIGIIAFVVILAFHLVTLPVELNASRRAVTQIETLGLLPEDQLGGARKVLRAAAMTYVASLAVAAANLIRILLIVNRRR